jgi:cell division protein FtsB
VEGVLVFAGCVVMLDALVGERGLVEIMRARQEYRALEESLTQLRLENARLRDEVRRLHEDPATIEDLARRELGLIRPGEKLFTIRDVPPGSR